MICRTNPGEKKEVMSDYEEGEFVYVDFSLEEGDVFNGRKVTRIDSVTLNDGQKHKKIIFESGSAVIEGLGYEDAFPFYSLYPSPTMPSEPTLTCCFVDNELLYHNARFIDCEGAKVANDKILEKERVAIAYTDDMLRIVFDDESLFDITVYNMQGVLVSQQKGNRYAATLSLAHVPQGVYVVRVSADGYAVTRKVRK